jgi:hypothetical protein
LEVQVLSPASARFTGVRAEMKRGMSVALALALTTGSLAAAALSIAYALVHR